MRVLATTVPGYGHLLPIVPLARALTDLGHEVRVATSASFVDTVREWGLNAFAAGLDWHESSPEDAELGPDAPTERAARISWTFRGAAPEPMANDLLVEADRWRPDLVVFDNVERGGLLYAEVTETPFAFLAHDTFLPTGLTAGQSRRAVEEFRRRRGLDRYDAARVRLGLEPDPDERSGFSQLVILSMPEVLWTLPPTWVFGSSQVLRTRPGPVDLHVDEELAAWVAGSEGPLAVVTLGTVFDGNEDLVEAAIAGLVKAGFRVVATGSSRDVLTDRVLSVRWAPLVALTRAADVVITHGGMGTITTALVTGTPLVVVPQGLDHPLTGLRIESAGVGVALAGTPSADAIRESSLQVTSERYNRRCGEVAADIATVPGVASIVPMLERHATRGPSRAG